MTPSRPHFDVELRVRYAETDQMGVVYHSEYLVWCEVGRTEYIRALGLPYAEMERRGALLAVADASLRYHGSARYDDLIRVETTLADVKSRAITFDYLIRHVQSGARLVTARTMLVSLDRDGRPAPIPADVRELLERAKRDGV
ncbi:MAG: thioesterase family protein [Gemmatimonadaceae bacterium]